MRVKLFLTERDSLFDTQESNKFYQSIPKSLSYSSQNAFEKIIPIEIRIPDVRMIQRCYYICLYARGYHEVEIK